MTGSADCNVSKSPLLLLPEGTQLPPRPYALALLIGVSGVVGLLWQLRPPVTDRTVLAFVPWIIAGGIAHGGYQLGTLPVAVAPLFGTVAAYLTTIIAAGGSWIIGWKLFGQSTTPADTDDESVLVGLFGILAVSLAIGGQAITGSLSITGLWPGIILLVTALLTVTGWQVLARLAPTMGTVAGWTGVVVLFGHALDGVSTAIGYDVLGASERTPLSALLLHLGEVLPTAEFIGAGWLFASVKLCVAGGVVLLFRGYLRDRPSEARLLLLGIAAMGLGPGTQNLTLYALGNLIG